MTEPGSSVTGSGLKHWALLGYLVLVWGFAFALIAELARPAAIPAVGDSASARLHTKATAAEPWPAARHAASTTATRRAPPAASCLYEQGS